MRDESDREGMRIVVELKRDVNANIILNQLYKHTQLQSSFSIIMLALHQGQPKVMNLKEMLKHYIDHQKEIIVRRTQYDLNKAEERAHILEGLRIALDHIDEIISILRGSKTVPEAKEKMMKRFGLTDPQATAIAEMRLKALTGLERSKIEDEYLSLIKDIEYYKSILASDLMIFNIVKNELLEIKKTYGDKRRSKITHSIKEFDEEDLIEEEEVAVT